MVSTVAKQGWIVSYLSASMSVSKPKGKSLHYKNIATNGGKLIECFKIQLVTHRDLKMPLVQYRSYQCRSSSAAEVEIEVVDVEVEVFFSLNFLLFLEM